MTVNALSKLLHVFLKKSAFGIQLIDQQKHVVEEYQVNSETNKIELPIADLKKYNVTPLVPGTILFSGSANEGSTSAPTKLKLNQVNADFSNVGNGIKIYLDSTAIMYDSTFCTTIDTNTLKINPSKVITVPQDQLTLGATIATITSDLKVGSQFFYNPTKTYFTVKRITPLKIDLTLDKELIFYSTNKHMFYCTSSIELGSTSLPVYTTIGLTISKIETY